MNSTEGDGLDRAEGHQAFDEFVTRRHASLLRTAYLLTGNRGSAENLLQTALFETFRRWNRLRDRNDPTAYVRRAMVNTQTSWGRRRASKELTFAVPPDREQITDGHPAERLHMWQTLLGLPPRMRAVLVLRFYEDMTEAETARVLGCSVGTVKSQTARGLARLRVDLENANDEEPTSISRKATRP